MTLASSLAGLRVIAVEQAVAAPLCTRHLADLGAHVVKIERPGTGDFARDYDNYVHGHSSHFVWLNGGKGSIELDVKTAAGRQTLLALLRTADVLVCNLAPGAFDKIFTDEELVAANPGLIRCFISGYGPRGPYAHRKAYDLLIQGEAGSIAATGTPDHPAKPGVSLADLAGGVYALAAINAALYSRTTTGQGQRIEISLFDVLLEWMSPLLIAQRHFGSAPEPAGLKHASIVPYGPYTSKDGEQVLVAVQNEGQWVRLCDAVLEDQLLASDPRVATNAGRIDHRAEVEDTVQRAISLLTTAELLARLERADVPHARLNQLADVIQHPQADASGRWSTVELPDGGEATVVTSPFHQSPRAARSVPGLGADTTDILEQLSRSTVADTSRRHVFIPGPESSE